MYQFTTIKKAVDDLTLAERENDQNKSEEIKDAIQQAWNNNSDSSRGGVKRKSRTRKNRRKTSRRRK